MKLVPVPPTPFPPNREIREGDLPSRRTAEQQIRTAMWLYSLSGFVLGLAVGVVTGWSSWWIVLLG